jgi:hypothetical protein
VLSVQSAGDSQKIFIFLETSPDKIRRRMLNERNTLKQTVVQPMGGEKLLLMSGSNLTLSDAGLQASGHGKPADIGKSA